MIPRISLPAVRQTLAKAGPDTQPSLGAGHWRNGNRTAGAAQGNAYAKTMVRECFPELLRDADAVSEVLAQGRADVLQLLPEFG